MNLFVANQNLISHQAFFDGLSGTWLEVETGFLATLAFCILLVLTKSWHGALRMDANDSIHKFHSIPTPRISGLSTVVAFGVVLFYVPPYLKSLIGLYFLAGLHAASAANCKITKHSS